MALERYRPELFPEVEAFAKRLKWFGYVRGIIRWHLDEGAPGSLWVWRRRRRLVAFCGVQHLNRRDAWLYGMRVAADVQGRGIARRFTAALVDVCREAGLSWVGINTYLYRRPSPVYRIAGRLGMRLEATDATDSFWDLPAIAGGPRPRRLPGGYRHWRESGRRVIFHEHPGWLWSRIGPHTRVRVEAGGCRVAGVPAHIVRHGYIAGPENRYRSTTVNLFDRPADFREVLPSLIAAGRGGRASLTLNYPFAWASELRRAARELVPGLRPGRNCWKSAWRVYGKDL
ncbi:MAG: GNAT family N-acetyltransferase [bacterium]